MESIFSIIFCSKVINQVEVNLQSNVIVSVKSALFQEQGCGLITVHEQISHSNEAVLLKLIDVQLRCHTTSQYTNTTKTIKFDKKHLQQPNPPPILTLVAPMLAAWAPAKIGSYDGSPHRGTV